MLTNVGYFMLFPLLTVHLTQDLGFDATGVGVVLAARMLMQQGTAPWGGALSDRIGYKPVIIVGFLIRTSGFFVYAFSQDVLGIMLGTVITSIGGSLFDPPSRAALAYLTPERDRQNVYAAAGMANWLGQVIGPLIGALLLPLSFFWVSVVSALAFLLAAVQAAVLLPGGMRGQTGAQSVWGSIGSALGDRDFSRVTGLLLGYYFLTVQSVITIPLLTTRLVGPEAIGAIFAIQAGTALLFQVPLTRLVSARMGPLHQMGLGMLLLTFGFLGYALAGSLLILGLCTAVVALGQLLVQPVQSSVTARLARGQGGAYFGVGALALAFGGSLGNGTGGLLLDFGDHTGHSWLPWVAMGVIALLSGLGFWLLARDARLRARLSPPPVVARVPAAAVGRSTSLVTSEL
jgi:DHA1 family multidrug resistance protein-like MFS transporter